MARLRSNFQTGVLSVTVSVGSTTFTSDALAEFPVVVPGDYAVAVFDPRAQFGPQEVVYITDHLAGAMTATILRGQAGTEAREHQFGIAWTHAPLAEDFLAEGAEGDALRYGEDGWEPVTPGYVHEQLVPTTVWMVDHFLNGHPAVHVEDSAGTDVVGDVRYLDRDHLTITFAVPFAGTAFLS